MSQSASAMARRRTAASVLALAGPRVVQAWDELGLAAVPDGFRSTFRDWAARETDHSRKVIEAALANVVRNRVKAAYARSELFDRTRVLTDDWARYLAQGIGCPGQAKKRQALIQPA